MTSKEEHHPAVGAVGGAAGAVGGAAAAAQEEAVGDQPHNIPERRHVDALLDISEDTLLKELEPFEYHCYSVWDDAVRRWDRAAPLSCILLTQKTYTKPKHKEADNPSASSVDSAPPNADSSGGVAEQRRESRGGLRNVKKSRSSNQPTGCWSQTAGAAQRPDTAEWSVLSAVQRNTAHFFLQDKIEEGGMLGDTHHLSKYPVWESRPTKPPKHIHRSKYITVPIKNIMFLPPITSPQLHSKADDHPCRYRKAPDGGTSEDNCSMLDKRSGTRRTRADTVVNSDLQISRHQTCQHNPQCLSAASARDKSLAQAPAEAAVQPSSLLSYGTRLYEMSSCARPVK